MVAEMYFQHARPVTIRRADIKVQRQDVSLSCVSVRASDRCMNMNTPHMVQHHYHHKSLDTTYRPLDQSCHYAP